MSADTSKVTLIEDFRDARGNGGVFKSQPDFNNPIYAVQAEFVVGASKALTNFRKEWRATHKASGWAEGIEMDIIPVLSEGMTMGFMVLSEIDGESYDYVPTKQIMDDEAENLGEEGPDD